MTCEEHSDYEQDDHVDRLIRDIAWHQVSPRADDVEVIRQRISTAPFNDQGLRVPIRDRGVAYLGRTLGDRENSAFLHLVRRVVIDRQWAAGTTVTDYLADLQNVARSDEARLLIYDRGQGAVAAAIGPNEIPSRRLGPMAQPYLFVAYSADRSCIIAGYQVSQPDRVNVTEDPIWLT